MSSTLTPSGIVRDTRFTLGIGALDAAKAYPDSLTREAAAAKANVSAASSGYEKNVSTLRSLGLITYPAKGTLQADPVLFLEKR